MKGLKGLRSIYVLLRRKWIYTKCLRSRLIILRYHSVGDARRVSEYLSPGLSITPARFREHLRLLKPRFRILTPQDIPELFCQKDRTDRGVIITFDDGYRDNCDVAVPILRRQSVTATFYVTTAPLTSGRGLWTSELWRLIQCLPSGLLELPGTTPRTVPEKGSERQKLRRELTQWLASLTAKEREHALNCLAERSGTQPGQGLSESFLTPAHLCEMRDLGMTIGAHTRSHPHLDRLMAESHIEEVDGSRIDLEEILGKPVDHFAYPNPGGGLQVTRDARDSVRRAGFSTAVTSTPGLITDRADLLRLPRIGVYAGTQERLLFGLIERLALL